ncbi:hypothetical protein GGS23DRAFT_571387, partial [Durotheca rogersii]|uniref:uncharacterized protein n=1 Tax=Durotheca rogersii TaxID=419775 RepID=UPI00221F39AE
MMVRRPVRQAPPSPSSTYSYTLILHLVSLWRPDAAAKAPSASLLITTSITGGSAAQDACYSLVGLLVGRREAGHTIRNTQKHLHSTTVSGRRKKGSFCIIKHCVSFFRMPPAILFSGRTLVS